MTVLRFGQALMNLKRTTTIVVVGGGFAVWLANAATSPRHDTIRLPSVHDTPAAIDARGEALAAEIARLHERLRPTITPHDPPRNLFQFTSARQPVVLAPTKPALTEAAPVVPIAPAAPPFKLIGIAEDAGEAGIMRTAIVSAPGQLFLVKEGQNVTLRYRVTKIGGDAVDLEDLGDHTTLRLALK